MASGAQAAADDRLGRSGGKILKARKTVARKTPYDRPIPPQSPLQQPESPSWLTGFVFPAKFVAGGASKILSSFWNPKSWGDPSSSSSDTDSDSEDDSGDDENPSDELIELNQKGSSSGKRETLHLIEQLLMLEHYSREECDRLTEIINSRVVDYSMIECLDAGPSKIHSRTNNDTPDIHSQAIMEAKKWVAEKKVGSGLKSDLDNGIYPLKSVMTPQSTEGEAGSPVDVARSYMRARPPWASPINHNNSLTSSPLAADLFKEGTPYSSVGGISFPSAKRDHLSGGSWNIQDEIRRLRSKATEDMLSSHRSIKTLKHDTPKRSLDVMERDEPINLGAPKSVDEIVNLDADGDAPGRSDTRTTQNDLPTEAFPSQPTTPVQEQYQGMDPVEMTRPSGERINDINLVDKNCYLMTESTEVPLVSNSQGSSNTKEDDDQSFVKRAENVPNESRAVTRAARRVKGRGK